MQQRAKEQPCRGDQHQRERELRGHENAVQPLAVAGRGAVVTGHAAPQRRITHTHRRHDTAHDRRQHCCTESNRDHARVGKYRIAGPYERRECRCRNPGKPHTDYGAQRGKQAAFRDELTHQARAAGAKSGTCRKFGQPRGAATEEQRRHVSGCNQ